MGAAGWKKSMSNADRLKQLERIYITSPTYVGILQKMIRCLDRPGYDTGDNCLLILGESGTGKSAIIRKFLQSVEEREGGAELRPKILAASLPAPAKVKGIASRLLHLVGDKCPCSGTGPGMTLRLTKYMKDKGYRLLVLNEFQHFIEKKSHEVLEDDADWLKDLIEEVQIPLILVGLPGSFVTMQVNEQFRRRFQAKVNLPVYGYNPDDDEDEFTQFLFQLDNHLPFPEMSNFADTEMAYRFHCASAGLIGYVMKVVRRAAEIAIDSHRKSVSLGDLGTAFEEEVLLPPQYTGMNPFTMALDTIVPLNLQYKEGGQPALSQRRCRRVNKERTLSEATAP
jgi:hypothetical protein